MDTTLRDGEQTRGVSFSLQDKLSTAKILLTDVNVDRIEVASAKVSEGEKETVKAICAWAEKEKFLDRVEVLGFVDFGVSNDWLLSAGCRHLNLLTKGSFKHCTYQLRKKPEEHFKDVECTIDDAISKGITVNVYFEDWSNGMRDSKDYVFRFAELLSKVKINRLMLPDTLGVLNPLETKSFIEQMAEIFPLEKIDFHAHNDYGLAVANSLVAVETGATGIHCTVNGLGERTGNASLAEVVAAINDMTSFECLVDEKNLLKVSRHIEQLSGKRLPSNKPIVGNDVFTQTAGIHADGDAKGNLYVNKLDPERFGRSREYALGKLSGKASLEHNLKQLKIDLTPEQKKVVLERIIALGDKKEQVTPADLPFIISDVLKTPIQKRFEVLNCVVTSSSDKKAWASFKLKYNGSSTEKSATGDGGYAAFMNALALAAEELSLKLPVLEDYEVIIPSGGKSDAIVKTKITWEINGNEFKTIGVDSDQVMAAIKATEKMLNTIWVSKQ
ncbi:MAG: 2-isopropylmalate synthase [Candidatus Diapherotrites archaeon CG11_big_fil_rev_8_21_14_0_20_37_9]|nr:MAG: 2-isopropylmalate synthase [Candidatus Diapherotrites archaeon CG11_big_fil_rev_8_21_14_0_20_37_9]